MNNYSPIIGKTYTLFGKNQDTQPYYLKIKDLANKILDDYDMGMEELLGYIHKVSRNRASLKRATIRNTTNHKLSSILELLYNSLAEYAPGVEQHLKNEPIHKCITDNSILSIREQYYLYMIEIELTNRLNKAKFLGCNYKIALLPYCLREMLSDCKSVKDEIDYYCKQCSKNCYINNISAILKEHDIHPYIWQTIRLKSLIKQLNYKYGSTGIMGIACIVELANGIRSCRKAGVPVVGIPLNANRCIRWMGNFYDNSVDLDELKSMVS